MHRLAKLCAALICGLALLSLLPASAAEDLNGKWKFTFDTEGGIRESVWELTVDGEKATAKSEAATLTGTFRDGKLEVSGEHYSDEAGYKAEFKISGTLDGAQLKGDASWDVYEMTFTGVRAD